MLGNTNCLTCHKKPASVARLALSTCECFCIRSFFLLSKTRNNEPSGGCVGSGLCGKWGTAYEERRVYSPLNLICA